MKISVFKVGELHNNCYIIIDNQNNGVLIDCNIAFEPIIKFMKENNINLKAILLTHGHFDHINGVKKMQDLTNAIVYIHKGDESMLNNEKHNLNADFSRQSYEPVTEYKLINDGDVIEIEDMKFEVIHTAGHTHGGVVYKFEDVLFTGDTLFAGTIGRADLPHSNFKTLLESVNKLKNLKGDYRVLAGHGDDTTLQHERETNQYMQEQDYDSYY